MELCQKSAALQFKLRRRPLGGFTDNLHLPELAGMDRLVLYTTNSYYSCSTALQEPDQPIRWMQIRSVAGEEGEV